MELDGLEYSRTSPYVISMITLTYLMQLSPVLYMLCQLRVVMGAAIEVLSPFFIISTKLLL